MGQVSGGRGTGDMSTMNDVHQFRSRTPSFLISAEPPTQVWHTSVLSKLDQVVATSYSRNHAEMTVLQQAHLYVDQLRREANKTRINVSEAIQDMKSFVLQTENEDCLVTGFSSQKPNPFREKSSCNLL